MRRIGVVLMVASLMAGLVGCGPASVAVTGKITRNGKPVTGTEAAPIQVSLCPMIGDREAFDKIVIAEVNQADGSFTASGVPIGKVRIGVSQTDRTTLADRFEGKFSEGESPIVRDLTQGQALTIDLAKPEK